MSGKELEMGIFSKEMEIRSSFWLSWFINQRALYNYALSIVRLALLSSMLSSVHISPSHRLEHRNFITGTHHLCPFWQSFWYLSFICYTAHIDSHRDCTSLLYLHTQKEQCHCNLFSEIYEHFL